MANGNPHDITLSYQDGEFSFEPDDGNVHAKQGQSTRAVFKPGDGVDSIDGALFFSDPEKTKPASVRFSTDTNTPRDGYLTVMQKGRSPKKTTYYYTLLATLSSGEQKAADPQWVDEPDPPFDPKEEAKKKTAKESAEKKASPETKKRA